MSKEDEEREGEAEREREVVEENWMRDSPKELDFSESGLH